MASQTPQSDKEFKKFKRSKEGAAFVTWVKDQYVKAKQARSLEVRQWNYNLAMYFGNQWVLVQNGGQNNGKFFNSNTNNKITVNRVKPVVRTELARLLSQKPAASVIPASSDDEDLFAAMAGEQLWESLVNRVGHRSYHRQFSKAAFWLVTTGTGFIKTYWDNSVPAVGGQQPTDMGDVLFASVQPYNLFVPDLLEQEIEEQPFVLEVTVRPVDLVNYKYKGKLEKPAVATARAALSVLEDAYVNQRAGNDAKPDSVYLYEIWIKPGGSPYAPSGGYALIVGDELVDFRPELPYSHGEYPYTKFEHIPTSKFYASSVIEDITPLNKEYNKIRTQINENRQKMGNMQLAAYKGSILPEKMTNQIGQIVLVRPGMQLPQVMQPAQLPAYISENMDRVLADIEDISGQHQVSKGNVPPGVTAATAISYLQERDDSLLTHTYQSIEEGTQKVASQSLNLCVQYWDGPRLVKIVGADGAFDAQLLSQAQLVNGTDVRIEAGSALPQSKAAKQALITDFMKFGWISPQDGLKMMEIGGAQKIFEQIRTDERQAQRENIRMKSLTPEIMLQHRQAWAQQQPTDQNTGIPLDAPPVISVNTYDNHQLHIDVHNRYRRSQAFELLSDEVKAEFEAHVNQHKFMMAMDTMQPMMFDSGVGSEVEAPPSEGTGVQEMMAQESGELSG